MDKDQTILLTGAAGFIGSYFLSFLNRQGFHNIYIVDEFNDAEKIPNNSGRQFSGKIELTQLFRWLQDNKPAIGYFIHLGARTDTTEFDYEVLRKLNLEYSKQVWQYCTDHSIPLIYASSAATYGAGEAGYLDDHGLTANLHPLNPYGVSKNEFDKWALQQADHPPFWAGLKFFNVYGPNEYHKGRMASVVFHSFYQVKKTGTVKLFRSHREGFRDGEQLRDFIYVADIANVMFWMMNMYAGKEQRPQPASGLYNLGTGKARSFNDLVLAVFSALNKNPSIQYIDIPPDIRETYQYYTCADMHKLRTAGYTREFYSLEDGVRDYVVHYLVPGAYY
jgi:ADP-L-glycero-D-manno-heptose 6-epimerase